MGWSRTPGDQPGGGNDGPPTGPGTIRPDGGQHQTNDTYAKFFIVAGIIIGSFAILVAPIILGPLGVICGLLARHFGRPQAGLQVAVWSALAAVIGFLLGLLVFL